jgi:beta-lactamase superfamily II metal-dependent hydrolase
MKTVADRPRSVLRISLNALQVFLVLGLAIALTGPGAAQARPSGPLRIYAIDVEGGQATLLVAPSGASLLVDTGWPSVEGNSADPYQKGLHADGMPDQDGRDVSRIEAAMKDAGITEINHVLITHFHVDHVGGVPNLVAHVKVGEFLDHGPNREDSDITRSRGIRAASCIPAIPSTFRGCRWWC